MYELIHTSLKDGLNPDKRVLVVWTGGWHDIGSASLVALFLAEHGISADVAGILSPAAHHTFDGNPEQSVNSLVAATHRTIPSVRGQKDTSISFTDPLWRLWAQENGLIGNYYELWLLAWTDQLQQELEQLSTDRWYQAVIGVDVGGDVLGTKADTTLLSPMMDFATLVVISQMKLKTLLVEFWLWSDGELRSPGIDRILREGQNTFLLEEGVITHNHPLVQSWGRMYSPLSTVRAWNTIPVTLQTLEPWVWDIDRNYQISHYCAWKKFTHQVPVTISGKNAGRVFSINPYDLALQRGENIFWFRDPFEQFLKLKKLQPSWKTEVDLFHFWIDANWSINNTKQGNSIFLLTPTTQLPEEQREEIIRHGLRNSRADYILLLDKDKGFVERSHDVLDLKWFTIVSKKVWAKFDVIEGYFKKVFL